MTKIKNFTINSIHKNTQGQKFIVLERLDADHFVIKFLATGYVTTVHRVPLTKGSIRDRLAPTVCGVGIIGVEIDDPSVHFLYDTWKEMLRRCYDSSRAYYKYYGAKGVKVTDEWLYFPKFVEDMMQKENVEKLADKKVRSQYQLDKDILGNEGTPIYSNETTKIVTRAENMRERNARCGNPTARKGVYQYTTDGELVRHYESGQEAAAVTGKDKGWIGQAANKEGGYAYGYIWRRTAI